MYPPISQCGIWVASTDVIQYNAQGTPVISLYNKGLYQNQTCHSRGNGLLQNVMISVLIQMHLHSISTMEYLMQGVILETLSSTKKRLRIVSPMVRDLVFQMHLQQFYYANIKTCVPYKLNLIG